MRAEGSYSVCFFVANIAGSLSTLATDSLSQSQRVTATLLPTSSLPTESSPERSSFTATVASLNVSAISSFQTHQSTLLRPSSTELVITASVIIVTPGLFVRFAISVPLNESVNATSFKTNLEKGILVAYKNGTSDERSGNVSVNVSCSYKEVLFFGYSFFYFAVHCNCFCISIFYLYKIFTMLCLAAGEQEFKLFLVNVY